MEKGLQVYDKIVEKNWILLPISFIIGSGVAYGKFRLFHFVGLLCLVPLLLRIKEKRIVGWELPFFLFVVWEFFSILWAADKNLSLKYLFCLSNGVLLLLSARSFFEKSVDSLQKVLKLLFYFNLAMMTFGFLETLAFLRWPLSFYSLSYYGDNISELMQVYKTGLEGLWFFKTQPAVFFWNTNDLCFYLVTTLPFIFITKIYKEWLKYIYIFLLYWILFASASRACLFGGIFVLVVIMLPFFKQSKEMIRYLFFILSLSICTIVFVQELSFLGIHRQSKIIALSSSFLTYTKVEKEPSNVKNFYSDSSTAKRSLLLENALLRFKESPIVGIGAGNLLISINGRPSTNLHNFWLEILIESGLVGAVLFLFGIGLWLYRIKFSSEWGVACLSFFSMAPSALAVSSAIYQPGFWIPLFLLFLLNENSKNMNQVIDRCM